MKKPIYVILIAIMTSSVAHSAGTAGYAGAFLRNGIGARPLGMGGAFTAVAEGPEAIYYNPAGLGYGSKVDFTSSYKTVALDRHFGFIGVSFPIRNEATMAAGWVYSGISNVVGRGNSQQTLGNIGNSHNAFTLSFSKVLRPIISMGVNLRYVQERLDNLESFTIGLDIGALAKPYKDLTVGWMIQNLGSTYRWESSKYWTEGSTYDERFPALIKIGAAYRFLSERLIPSIDFETSDKGGLQFRGGAEYWFTRKVIRKVQDEYEEGVYHDVEVNVRQAGLRAGIDRGAPTFGLSLMREFGKVEFGFEYAFLLGKYGTSPGHMFTLNLGF